jgi:hypothetical protein
MNRLALVCGVLALFLPASTLVAQSSDWQALQGVPEGTKIKIKLKHGRTFGHCMLEEIAINHLACYYSATGTRVYPRDDIKAVLLGRHSARVGLAVGLGTGFALGAARGCCGVDGRILFAGLFAPLLGGIGAGVGAVVDPFVDGKVIYISPASDPPQRAGKNQLSARERSGSDESIPR